MSSHFTVIKSGGSAIDAPIAALAGLSVAFAAFTIPADLLGQLVVATGLPSIVPVAQPPLGLNARLLLAGFGAIGVFAVAFVALRLLGRIGRRPRRVEIEEAIEEATPVRLRRRDFHPDAPPPAPLRARELGEPMTPGLWDRAEREAPETPAATTVEAGSAIFEAEPEVAAPEPAP